MTGVIVYLHGFKSSPHSFKAQLIAQTLEQNGGDWRYICPQLQLSPQESVDLVSNAIRDCQRDRLTIIGSSLGGYYAHWLAEQHACKAVLLNPVIDPWQIKILDDIPDRSDLRVCEWLDFRERYEGELKAIRVKNITNPSRYLLLAAKGDELLDWCLMQSHYHGAHQVIVDGGDHGLSDFGLYLEKVLSFCGIGKQYAG
ncbi:MAG: esterase [Oxalobacter sp.]|nr:esterase [Oxalobacter sp.]